MTQMSKYVDSVRIEMTPDEVSAREAEEAANAAIVYVPQIITRRQFLIAAGLAGYISQQEALAAAQDGSIPVSILTYFGTLPSEQQFAAKVTWATMTQVGRNEPLLAACAAALNITGQQIDNLFIQGAAL